MATKGIVVGPPLSDAGLGAVEFQVPSRLPPVYLRECALYWDLIDLPRQDRIDLPIELDRDAELLAQEGILIRSEVDFSGIEDAGFAPVTAQILATQRHNKEGGKWTIGQNASHLELPNDPTHRTRVAEIELYKSVPVPLADVPMEEVLEFKMNRHTELTRFRETLDSMYQEIAASNDIQRTKRRKIEEVRESVIDLNRVMNESWPRRILRTVKSTISLDPVTGGIALATATIDLGTAAGIALGSIGFDERNGNVIDPVPESLQPFAYVSHAQEEFGPES